MLPKNLKYGQKLESALAKSYKSNIQPQSGNVFGFSDTITFNIPTRNNTLLVPTESYLKFNVVLNNASGAANSFRWDSAGANQIIYRLRIYSGSNLLQEINDYGLLAKMLFDVQVPFDATYGKYNILSGCRSDMTATTNVAGAYAQNAVVSVFNTNSGDIFASALANNTDSASKTYCINLISLLGTLCSNQYFPLFACTSAPIRLELTLVDNINRAMSCTTGTGVTLKLSNCEYVGNFINISDQAVSMIYDSLGGQPLQFCVPDYRSFSYSATLPTSVSTISFPIPAKYSSLKSLYITQRDKLNGTDTFFPCSSVTKQIQDYNFRIGSQIFPSKAPSTYPEMFAELLKATASMSDLNHHPAVDNFSYTLQDSVANGHTIINVNSGSFYVGIDLESYANSDKSNLFMGWNSTTDDIYFQANYAGQASATNVLWNCFALFDSVVTFENNVAFVKY